MGVTAELIHLALDEALAQNVTGTMRGLLPQSDGLVFIEGDVDLKGTAAHLAAKLTDIAAPQRSSEGDIRAQMVAEADKGNLSVAAMRALELAELVGARSPEGAAIYTARAQVYATLNQAEVVLWIKNNPL